MTDANQDPFFRKIHNQFSCVLIFNQAYFHIYCTY